jgi:hypothetical protein
VVRQGPAKPRTPVRFRSAPLVRANSGKYRITPWPSALPHAASRRRARPARRACSSPTWSRWRRAHEHAGQLEVVAGAVAGVVAKLVYGEVGDPGQGEAALEPAIRFTVHDQSGHRVTVFAGSREHRFTTPADFSHGFAQFPNMSCDPAGSFLVVARVGPYTARQTFPAGTSSAATPSRGLIGGRPRSRNRPPAPSAEPSRTS